MLLQEFVNRVYGPLPPGWRRGQWMFNLLLEMRPDLAERVRRTDVDPFYDDEVIPALAEWLAVNWGSGAAAVQP